MKVTNDIYELPIAVADSAEELAELLHVKSYRDVKMKCKRGIHNFKLVIINTSNKDKKGKVINNEDP